MFLLIACQQGQELLPTGKGNPELLRARPLLRLLESTIRVSEYVSHITGAPQVTDTSK